jgi:heat shock protein HtpX
VRFAGGRDPGPLAVPQFDQAEAPEETVGEDPREGPDGPYGPSSGGGKPFLPNRPPIELGTPQSSDPGPWGPHGGSR